MQPKRAGVHAVGVWPCRVLTFPGCPRGRGRWRSNSCTRWRWRDRATGSPVQSLSYCRSVTRAPSPKECTAVPSAGLAAGCWASQGCSSTAWPRVASWTQRGTVGTERKNTNILENYCNYKLRTNFVALFDFFVFFISMLKFTLILDLYICKTATHCYIKVLLF